MNPLTKGVGDFRPIWWLWLPCAMVIAALLIRMFKADIYWEWIESEIGFFEIGTVVVFFVPLQWESRSYVKDASSQFHGSVGGSCWQRQAVFTWRAKR